MAATNSSFFADDMERELAALKKRGRQRFLRRVSGPQDPEIVIEGRKNKKEFLTHTEAYHGDTIGSVSAGGIDLFHRIFGPLLFTTQKMPTPHCYRCPYGLKRETCSLYCADRMEEKIRTQKETLAAVIVEPLVQGAAGMLMMPPGYLSRIRKVTKECDVLLVCDEVATGFGRTGTMFASQQEDVSPDIMTVAKGLTGGYLPLAATLVTEDIYNAFLGRYEEFKAFFHGHSYTANPLGCAAGLATLGIFEREDVLEHVALLAEVMAAELAGLGECRWVGDIRQRGLMVGIEMVEDRNTRTPFPPERKIGQRVIIEARGMGFIIRPLGDVVVLMPPLFSTTEEIVGLVACVRTAIEKVLGKKG